MTDAFHLFAADSCIEKPLNFCHGHELVWYFAQLDWESVFVPEVLEYRVIESQQGVVNVYSFFFYSRFEVPWLAVFYIGLPLDCLGPVNLVASAMVDEAYLGEKAAVFLQEVHKLYGDTEEVFVSGSVFRELGVEFGFFSLAFALVFHTKAVKGTEEP